MDRAAEIDRLLQIQELQEAEAARAQPEPTLAAQALEVGKKGLGLGLRGLDYLGGISRTAIAGVPNAINVLAGNESVVHPEDLLAALKGRAPTTAEYLERAQAPEMGSFRIPFTQKKITGRDVVGFVGDVAADPLTYATLGASGASKLGKAAKIASGEAAIEGVGRNIYKGGFGAVDRELAEKGVAPISETLFKEGFVGTAEGARKATDKLRLKAGEGINQAVADAGNVMVKPDFSNAYKTIDKMRKDPNLIKEADALEDFVKQYANKGEYSLGDALEIKRNVRNALPQSVYRPSKFGAKPIAPATKVESEVAKAFTKASDEAGGTALKSSDLKYGQANAALPLLQREAKKAARKKSFTIVDALLLGASTGAPQFGLPALALKKGVEAANTTLGRTLLGQGLRVSQKPLAATFRRAAPGMAEYIGE